LDKEDEAQINFDKAVEMGYSRDGIDREIEELKSQIKSYDDK